MFFVRIITYQTMTIIDVLLIAALPYHRCIYMYDLAPSSHSVADMLHFIKHSKSS